MRRAIVAGLAVGLAGFLLAGCALFGGNRLARDGTAPAAYGIVQGMVTDASGRPLANARVVLTPAAPGSAALLGSTGTTSGTPAASGTGTPTSRATSPGPFYSMAEVVSDWNASTWRSITRRATATATTSPASTINAAVSARTAGSASSLTATTDSNGRYRLDGVSPGPWILTISVPGHRPAGRFPAIDREGRWVVPGGGQQPGRSQPPPVLPLLESPVSLPAAGNGSGGSAVGAGAAGPGAVSGGGGGDAVQFQVQVVPGRETVVPAVRFSPVENGTLTLDSVLVRVALPRPGETLQRRTTYEVRVKCQYELLSASEGVVAVYILDDTGQTVVRPEPGSKAVALVSQGRGTIDLGQNFNTDHPYRRRMQVLVAIFPADASETTSWTVLAPYPIASVPDALVWPEELGRVRAPMISDPRHNLVYGLTTASRLLVINPSTWNGYLLTLPGAPHRMAISPDYRYLYFGANYVNTIYRLDLDSGYLSTLPSRPSPIPVAAADGNRLVYISCAKDNQQLCVIDTETGRELWSAPTTLPYPGEARLIEGIAYAPASRSVLAPAGYWGIARYRLEDSGELVAVEEATYQFYTPTVETNGEYVWVGSSRFKSGDISRGPVSQLPTGYLNVIAVSPDGRYVVTRGKGLCDAATGACILELTSLLEGSGAAFTPDGRYLIYADYDVYGDYWYMVRRRQLP